MSSALHPIRTLAGGSGLSKISQSSELRRFCDLFEAIILSGVDDGLIDRSRDMLANWLSLLFSPIDDGPKDIASGNEVGSPRLLIDVCLEEGHGSCFLIIGKGLPSWILTPVTYDAPTISNFFSRDAQFGSRVSYILPFGSNAEGTIHLHSTLTSLLLYEVPFPQLLVNVRQAPALREHCLWIWHLTR